MQWLKKEKRINSLHLSSTIISLHYTCIIHIFIQILIYIVHQSGYSEHLSEHFQRLHSFNYCTCSASEKHVLSRSNLNQMSPFYVYFLPRISIKSAVITITLILLILLRRTNDNFTNIRNQISRSTVRRRPTNKSGSKNMKPWLRYINLQNIAT